MQTFQQLATIFTGQWSLRCSQTIVRTRILYTVLVIIQTIQVVLRLIFAEGTLSLACEMEFSRETERNKLDCGHTHLLNQFVTAV